MPGNEEMQVVRSGTGWGNEEMQVVRSGTGWGDVVFNEVMYDPEPVVGLEAEEYLELFNRSPWMIDLEGWRVSAGSRTVTIHDRLLEPGCYTVITGLVLPNDGTDLTLYGPDRRVVHAVSYNEPWNGPEWKKGGGWSLESPDPDRVCGVSQLWEYSSDRSGGTPGRINSCVRILEDTDPPVLLYHGIPGPGVIRLWFSEPVRSRDGDVDFSRETAVMQPGHLLADSVVPGSPMNDRLLAFFPDHATGRTGYKLNILPLADCALNRSGEWIIRTGKAGIPEFGSLLISEIMSDPADNAPWFVELYNPGPHSLDLREIAMSMSREGGSTDNLVPLSEHSRILNPDSYLVVTESVPYLEYAYHLERSGAWLEFEKKSGPPRDAGIIYLADRAGAVVDVVHYDRTMHMELLDRTDGISLERISYDRPGNDAGNWHSASSAEGYATPGRANSQASRYTDTDALLELIPRVFSPDNDGFEDILNITVKTGMQGVVIRLWITDLNGRLIRTLANNHLTGPVNLYTWDGETEEGRMVREGFYVVHLHAYLPGSWTRWRKRSVTGVIYR